MHGMRWKSLPRDWGEVLIDRSELSKHSSGDSGDKKPFSQSVDKRRAYQCSYSRIMLDHKKVFPFVILLVTAVWTFEFYAVDGKSGFDG